jgi:hypothetical protein
LHVVSGLEPTSVKLQAKSNGEKDPCHAQERLHMRAGVRELRSGAGRRVRDW